MDLNITAVHCIDLTVSLLALLFLYLVVKKIGKDDFVVTMLVMSMALMVNIILFSSVYLIDNLDRQLSNPFVYSFWSAFIRLQDCVTILWISVLAYFRIHNTTAKQVTVELKQYIFNSISIGKSKFTEVYKKFLNLIGR